MMNKFIKSSNTPLSLIDCIAPEPENELKLLSTSAIDNGIRFRFEGRGVLPKWYFMLAHRLDFAAVDDDPGGTFSRIVSLVDERKSSRKTWHSDPKHIANA